MDFQSKREEGKGGLLQDNFWREGRKGETSPETMDKPLRELVKNNFWREGWKEDEPP
jgi:hypothetical protein